MKMLNRAERLRQAAPDFWPTWLAAADALRRVGREEEAGRLLQQTVRQFPNEYWPNHAVAQHDVERSDQRTAIQVWSALASRFPSQRSAAEALKTAQATAADPASGRSSPSSARFRPSRRD